MLDRFYQPAILWEYFSEWFEKSHSGEDAKPYLYLFRLTQGGAYRLVDDKLKWSEKPLEQEPDECNQNELWVNQDDLGLVEVYVEGKTDEPIHSWGSFRDFIKALQE